MRTLETTPALTQLALRLAEIAEEVQQPGYQGHALVPRYLPVLESFYQSLVSAGLEPMPRNVAVLQEREADA